MMFPNNCFRTQAGNLTIFFHSIDGGMPSRVELCEYDNTSVSVITQPSRLELELKEGRILHPVIPLDMPPETYEADGTRFVEFTRLDWVDEYGQTEPDFLLSLRHEFMADGTAFTTAFFTVERNTPPVIKRFELSIPLDLSDYDNVRWSLTMRPTSSDGPIIQSFFPERYLERGVTRKLDHGIFPMAGFNADRKHAPGLYAEFFVEGDNVLAGQSMANESSITWQNGSPVMRWNFQNAPTPIRSLPLHWRNRWGWIIKTPPIQRHLPPLHMYHFFDLGKHYPDALQLEAIADSGCNLLILHENWRRDVQNDGIPYNMKKFREVVEFARKHNIRIAVYIRGNEISAKEEACRWFRHLLQPDFDGLYMDYGSPYGDKEAPNECYHNGRLCFRRHYQKFKALRETVGKNGLLFYHTGTSFSALGASFTDGYVSGEGEKGIMIKGRAEHAFFSMANAALGTMWTAAFPEYSTPRMVPFMAATGQYPHNPLGIQFVASSLIHPPEPGINDLNFRELWKLWSCFSKESDVIVYNDYNSRNQFSCDNENCGFYAMVSDDEKRCLLIVTNFSNQTKNFHFSISDKLRACMRNKKWKLLTFDSKHIPQETELSERDECTIELAGYGVAGILAADSMVALDGMLTEYRKNYHQPGLQGQTWIQTVERQKSLRHTPPKWRNVYLTVTMPCYQPLSFEDSMIIDLYDVKIQLGEILPDGKFRKLGYIGKHGLSPVDIPQEEQLFPGDSAQAIALHELLPPGHYRLALYSEHLGMPFYSFIEATLASDKSEKNAYTVEFRNELELDRAYLTWETLIV